MLPAQTYGAYALLRSSIAGGSDEEVAAAVEYGKRSGCIRWPKPQNHNRPCFHDTADTLFDGTFPYDLRFYQTLDRFVQAEPWQTRD